MSFNFIIPQDKNALLRESDDSYYVKELIGAKEITSKLNEAKACLRDEGAVFILDNFDVYFSLLHQKDPPMDVMYTAYQHLHKATKDFGLSLGLLFDEKDCWTDESKVKYTNVLKMLLYIYNNIVILIEDAHQKKRDENLTYKARSRKKVEEDDYSCDHKAIITAISGIMQQEIILFWDPPVVDDFFVNMVAEICYKFLELPTIKQQKETRTLIWDLLGLLVTTYNHGTTFLVRIVSLVKTKETLVTCVPEGVQHVVEQHNCKRLLHDFVCELTEWQADDNFTDTQGARNCSKVLSEMAILMPNLIIPEVKHLYKYLAHDPYPLRNSILDVITEVVLKVLTKSDLTDEERVSRDELLSVLEEHLWDTSSYVRSNMFQNWARLQTENAVPIKMQTVILEKTIMHLRDKAASVRKSAAHCVTTFLEHNLYSSTLQLSRMKEEWEKANNEYVMLNAKMEGIQVEVMKQQEEEWNKHEEAIKTVIEKKLEEISQESEEVEISEDEMPDLIKTYVREKKYDEAFAICRCAGKKHGSFREVSKNLENEQEKSNLYLLLMRTIFLDMKNKLSNLPANSSKAPTEEELTQLTSLARTLDYQTDLLTFLQLIDNAMEPMKDLLQSITVGDMQEAVRFFVTAYKFNIDRSEKGVIEMLKIIPKGEQDRKDVIFGAFKQIYLVTDSTSMTEHTTIIVNRLIELVKSVEHENFQDLSLIISEWVSKGTLDNSIIDMLWQYFTKKVSVTDEQSRAALVLLTMAAQGRNSIITRNVKLVATVAFGERGLHDILLVTQACKILSVASLQKQNITDKNPPYKIKVTDTIWKELCDIIVTYFNKKVKFVNLLIPAAIDFIYRLCATPIKIINTLVTAVLKSVFDMTVDGQAPGYLRIRCNILLGTVALKQLNFLDEIIYKEIKRRNYIREERKNTKTNKKTKRPDDLNSSSAIKLASRLNTSGVSNETDENFVLEGAQAEDADAEYISRLLESRTVTEHTSLGNLAHIIVEVLAKPDVYNNENLQCASITALIRYMLVSNEFCKKYIRLVFTILEKTTYIEVKRCILIQCSDLLEKCPNLIEPYTPHIYSRLQDPNLEVRKTTLYMLSNLILRDMTRPQENISEIAVCIMDDEEALSKMAKEFFERLSNKITNMHNILPDIFSHLSVTISEEKLRIIMKYLFGLMDKNKQMEYLVDRFCAKFRLMEDEKVAANIAYCLSLLQFNEKGLKKLVENFHMYKHQILINEVYSFFKQIISNCQKGQNKQQAKILVSELEEKIKAVFEISGEKAPPDVKVTSATKKPAGVRGGKVSTRGRGRGRQKRKPSVSEDSDSDE